ncbi:MAG: ABC transporter permease subunit [Chitinivibrionales bacterium]|nr:ABC transporter permease subunit [Chitinivibrionales bacterium]MBD3396561.1 ABC transporter permease subunit [Chitinivibrionales bacterium]
MSRFSLQRLRAVMRKEARHIARDPQTLSIVVLMPVIMMFIYGYALSTDVKDVRIAVEDPSRSTESAAIVRALDAGTLFKVTRVENVVPDPKEYFRKYRDKALVRIPPNLASAVRASGRGAMIQVLIDGSDPNLATIIRNASQAAITDPLLAMLHIEKPEPVKIHMQVLYNPRQESAFYFVPGLMVLILTMMSALLTSIALVREKELGTLSQLVISPLQPFEIVVGKILPYMLVAAIDGALVLLIGRWAFDVRISGSALLLAAVSVLYIFVSLCIGLLISALTHRQLHAMIGAVVVTLMPTVILTGFIFPVSSMPVALQAVSHVLPATYFLRVVRAIILKGVGIDMLWQPVGILVAQGLILITIAVRKFRTAL